MTSSILFILARLPGPIVTCFLATIGSFTLNFSVMSECTTNYSCGPGSCEPCSAASALLIGGWVLQGVLFAATLTLWLPRVLRRFRRQTVVALALVVPVVSILAFAGVSWGADRSYCRPGQSTPYGYENYCDV